jgi:hypothetical protein
MFELKNLTAIIYLSNECRLEFDKKKQTVRFVDNREGELYEISFDEFDYQIDELNWGEPVGTLRTRQRGKKHWIF